MSFASSGLAQTTDDSIEEVIATGEIQRALEQSLKVKRETTAISDALVGAEIGDLPDLSIAETLERVTGVTSDRFKGGASNIAIRGLGPFLGTSLLNGREITSGADGRDVNFGQFPSELLGGVQVFKSQQADFAEGGISGVINLQTLRPLDFNRRRIQVQGLLGYSDYEDRVADGEPFSTRLSGSYVDQFETGMGDIGISIGGQIRRDTAPEEVYTTSSNFRACNSISPTSDNGGNCSFRDDGPSDLYLVSNQYTLARANQTQADRDTIIGSLQWQPNAEWDINLDAQWSDRRDNELRHNLVIGDGRRRINPVEIAPSGALLVHEGETRIENQSVFRQRDERFFQVGGNAAWTNEKYALELDVNYSDTERRQDELDMRIRTQSRVDFRLDNRDTTVPSFTILDGGAFTLADLNDHDNFTNGARARRRPEDNDNSVFTARLDGDYAVEGNFITNIGIGARYVDLTRTNDDGNDVTLSLESGNYFNDAAIAARRDVFPIENLFEGEDNTNLQGITFATWNPEELFVALTGSRDAGFGEEFVRLDASDSDITEKTYAVYGMADFETNLLSLPAYGNFGVRVVKTDIESVGFAADLTTSENDDGTIAVDSSNGVAFTETNSFTNVLPSANLIFEVQEDKLLRFAAYNAIARPNPRGLSAALRFQDESDEPSLVDIVSAAGNPQIEPLKAQNFDVSFEWYKSEDTAFTAAAYWKRLQTGFEQVVESVDLNVNGSPQSVPVTRPNNSDEDSSITGFELTLNHKFSYLPSILSGFGFQANYNYASSDFKFPSSGTLNGVALADVVAPGGIDGASEHTGNVVAFWENDDLSMRLAYKGRSVYLKNFRNGPNRFTAGQEFVDFSASYDVTDNIQVRFQGLNLFDEPNVFFRPTPDSLAQADYSGRRFFAGVRVRY
jgi:TonB-dependent receptor